MKPYHLSNKEYVLSSKKEYVHSRPKETPQKECYCLSQQEVEQMRLVVKLYEEYVTTKLEALEELLPALEELLAKQGYHVPPEDVYDLDL